MSEKTKAGGLAQRAAAAALRPPPQLTVSEWADRERYLSPEFECGARTLAHIARTVLA